MESIIGSEIYDQSRDERERNSETFSVMHVNHEYSVPDAIPENASKIRRDAITRLTVGTGVMSRLAVIGNSHGMKMIRLSQNTTLLQRSTLENRLLELLPEEYDIFLRNFVTIPQ